MPLPCSERKRGGLRRASILTASLVGIGLAAIIPAWAEELPAIKILATGGTIAGVGESATGTAYASAKVPVENLLRAVPEIHEIARVSGEQIVQIGSQAMTPEVWLKLGKRVNELAASDEVDGIVITHGTDTMEETAYFLNLTVHSDKPVALVGAMRPATGLSADGPGNLLDAVTVASMDASRGRGAMIVMNDTILPARGTTKRNTTNVATFVASNTGPLGSVVGDEVFFDNEPVRRHTAGSGFRLDGVESLPRVDIISGYAGDNSALVEAAVAAGARGIVFAGVGNGNLNPEIEKALAEARANGVAVVRSSRTGSGRVTLDAEVDDEKYGFVVADDLSPQQARVLLMLALTKTNEPAQLQEIFFRY